MIRSLTFRKNRKRDLIRETCTSRYVLLDVCISYGHTYVKALVLIVALQSPVAILSSISGTDACVWCQRGARRPDVWGLTGPDGGAAGLRVPGEQGRQRLPEALTLPCSHPPPPAAPRRGPSCAVPVPVPRGAAPFGAPSSAAPGAASALLSVEQLASRARRFSVVGEQYPSDTALPNRAPRWP